MVASAQLTGLGRLVLVRGRLLVTLDSIEQVLGPQGLVLSLGALSWLWLLVSNFLLFALYLWLAMGFNFVTLA